MKNNNIAVQIFLTNSATEIIAFSLSICEASPKIHKIQKKDIDCRIMKFEVVHCFHLVDLSPPQLQRKKLIFGPKMRGSGRDFNEIGSVLFAQKLFTTIKIHKLIV